MWSLRNCDGDGDAAEVKWRLKNEFIFYQRIPRFSKVTSFVSHCEIESEYGTRHKIRNIIFSEKLSVVVQVLRTTQNWVISHGRFTEDGKDKKCTRYYNARAQPLYCLFRQHLNVMDQQRDRQGDREIDGWTNDQTDWQTDRQTDGQTKQTGLDAKSSINETKSSVYKYFRWNSVTSDIRSILLL